MRNYVFPTRWFFHLFPMKKEHARGFTLPLNSNKSTGGSLFPISLLNKIHVEGAHFQPQPYLFFIGYIHRFLNGVSSPSIEITLFFSWLNPWLNPYFFNHHFDVDGEITMFIFFLIRSIAIFDGFLFHSQVMIPERFRWAMWMRGSTARFFEKGAATYLVRLRLPRKMGRWD